MDDSLQNALHFDFMFDSHFLAVAAEIVYLY